MPTLTDHSCGVIPYRVLDGTREFLLVQHTAGHWAFPKGHPKGDETPIDTARRELAEETGLTAVRLLEAPAFEEAYVFTKRSGKRVEKTVTYYLGRIDAAAGQTVRVQEQEVADHAWGTVEQTAGRLTFPEGRALLEQVRLYFAASASADG
jgi:8-oxo-dGTP pyrophosphatase MutT (NUDIX family)